MAETPPPFWQKVKKKQFFMPPLIIYCCDKNFRLMISKIPSEMQVAALKTTLFRGGIKNWLKGEGVGVSRPIQKILIRKYSDFFYQFWPIIDQIWPILTNFDLLLTNFDQFWTIFDQFFFIKGGGVLPNPKNPYQKKMTTEVVKRGGGGSQFFY